MRSEILKDYGIDYDVGLKNCIGNADFYEKILSMFLADGCFEAAKAAFLSGDRAQLFARMHELKGSSGNSGCMGLYSACSAAVDLLRKPESSADEALPQLFEAVETAYNLTIQGIRLAIQE